MVFTGKEVCTPIALRSVRMQGQTGILADKIAKYWLYGMRESQPAILDVFRERNVTPYRELLPWSGEFAGKHITSAYYIYRMTGDPALYEDIRDFIREMLSYMDGDGYLGCFSDACKLTGAFSQSPGAVGGTWDAWNHYHIMYGLLCWYEETKDPTYLAATERMAGLFMRTFYGDGGPTLLSMGSAEMNMAPYHVFVLLYEITGQEAYLSFARKIEAELAKEGAGDYLRLALRGVDYYLCPKPRWESMHIIMGIAEMYAATGEASYLQAARQITKSILRTDVHNTGAFSTDEQAVGDPYAVGNIETCCVVAYNALVMRVFELTGDMHLLDFLELSHYNAILGANSPSGRWSTYHTPMDGTKCANVHSIGFQCRAGSPFLNCCSVNAPRGVGSIGRVIMTETEGVPCLNFFEAGTYETDGGLRITVTGDYPAPGALSVRIEGAPCTSVGIRIPGWSKQTTLTVNGASAPCTPGAYAYIRTDTAGVAEMCLSLDFSLRYEAGHGAYEGKTSVYAGPLLFGFDGAYNLQLDAEAIPPISRGALAAATIQREPNGAITLRTPEVTLVDFYHLGVSGSVYKTWLPIV